MHATTEDVIPAVVRPRWLPASKIQWSLGFELLFIATTDGIGDCRNNNSFRTDSLSKFPVIKLVVIGLARGLINVLYVGKNSNYFTMWRVSSG